MFLSVDARRPPRFRHRKIFSLTRADSVGVSADPARHPPYFEPPALAGAVLVFSSPAHPLNPLQDRSFVAFSSFVATNFQ